jgi:hypothetical protein
MAGLLDIPFRSDTDFLSIPTASLTDWMYERAPEGNLFSTLLGAGVTGDRLTGIGDELTPGSGLPPFRSDTDLLSGPTRLISEGLAQFQGLPGKEQAILDGTAPPSIQDRLPPSMTQEGIGYKDSPEDSPPTREEIKVKAQKIPETPKEAAEQSQVEAQQVRVQLQDQGASEEDLSAWDKFNNEFDLTTVGLMLMASAGNGQGLAANLGTALLKSKQMKQAQQDKDIAAAAAGRDEAREERKVRAEEFRAQVAAENAESGRMRALAAMKAASADYTIDPGKRQKALSLINSPELEKFLENYTATQKGDLADYLAMQADKRSLSVEETLPTMMKYLGGELRDPFYRGAYYGR